jgi:hypothetical protein
VSSSFRDRLGLEVRVAGPAALITALSAPAAGALLFAILDATGKSGADLDRTTGDIVAGLCPLGVAIAASSIVGRDPGAELVMTTPASYRRVLFLRAAVIALLGAAATFVTASFYYGLRDWPSGQGASGLVLLWLPPMAWLAALGMLVAVAVRSTAAASGLVGGLWIAQVVFHHNMQDNAVLRAQYLFIRLAGDFPGRNVTLTQAALLAVGTVAVAVTGLLLARPERLLAGDAS